MDRSLWIAASFDDAEFSDSEPKVPDETRDGLARLTKGALGLGAVSTLCEGQCPLTNFRLPEAPIRSRSHFRIPVQRLRAHERQLAARRSNSEAVVPAKEWTTDVGGERSGGFRELTLL